MYSVNVTITGTEPGLLQHKFGAAVEAGLQNPVKRKDGNKYEPSEEAEAACYRDGEGHLVQPGEHIFQALIKAAGGFQIQGQGKKSYKDVIKGTVLVTPEYIRHKQDTYDIDQRPVRIMAARIMRCRPWLKEWTLSFQLRVLEDRLLPLEVLHSIMVDVGEKVGIGDYRPRFGRFIVNRFEKA